MANLLEFCYDSDTKAASGHYTNREGKYPTRSDISWGYGLSAEQSKATYWGLHNVNVVKATTGNAVILIVGQSGRADVSGVFGVYQSIPASVDRKIAGAFDDLSVLLDGLAKYTALER